MQMMPRTRRHVMLALGAAPGASVLAQPAADSRQWRLGWLSATPRSEPFNAALVQRLAELGFVEGRNLTIEVRTGQMNDVTLRAMADELGRLRCDAYFAPATLPGVQAMLQASREVPIVTVANDYDPVAVGIAASLARPGGRVTGVYQLNSELAAKRLDLVRELLPRAKRVGVLADAVTQVQLRITREAAGRLGLELLVHEFGQPPYDMPAAFDRLVAGRVEVVLPLASGLLAAQRDAIVTQTLARKLPAIYPSSVWVERGGLMSYGSDFSAAYRRAGEMLALLLRGASPATMPFEQSTIVETVINLNTADAVGVAVTPAMRLRADRVIQ